MACDPGRRGQVRSEGGRVDHLRPDKPAAVPREGRSRGAAEGGPGGAGQAPARPAGCSVSPSLGSQIQQFSADVGTLVETHTTSVKARDFTRYADDPVGFMRDVLRAAPWSRQEE